MPSVPPVATPPRRRGVRSLVAGTAVLAGLIAFDLGAMASASPLPGYAHRSATVNGETVGADPTVRSGQVLDFTVSGYAPGAPVTATLRPTGPALATLRADARGRAHVQVAVPALPSGGYELVVTGSAVAGTTSHGSGNLVATVPRIARYPFRVRGSR